MISFLHRTSSEDWKEDEQDFLEDCYFQLIAKYPHWNTTMVMRHVTARMHIKFKNNDEISLKTSEIYSSRLDAIILHDARQYEKEYNDWELDWENEDIKEEDEMEEDDEFDTDWENEDMF